MGKQVDPAPELAIEITVKGRHVRGAVEPGHWTLPPGVSVHVFDYDKDWGKDVVEPDDQKGELCKQTIFVGQDALKGQEPRRVRVYIRSGDVNRIIMPAGSVVVVKTFKKEGAEPEVKRWIHRKK